MATFTSASYDLSTNRLTLTAASTVNATALSDDIGNNGYSDFVVFTAPDGRDMNALSIYSGGDGTGNNVVITMTPKGSSSGTAKHVIVAANTATIGGSGNTLVDLTPTLSASTSLSLDSTTGFGSTYASGTPALGASSAAYYAITCPIAADFLITVGDAVRAASEAKVGIYDSTGTVVAEATNGSASATLSASTSYFIAAINTSPTNTYNNYSIGVIRAAKTYYVKSTGSDSANGTSTSTPFQTIYKAVSVAKAGDTIVLLDMVYQTTAAQTSVTLSGSQRQVTLPANVSLIGGASGAGFYTDWNTTDDSATAKACLTAGSGCVIANITVTGTAANTKYQLLVGWNTADTPSVGVTVANCVFNGISDGSYFNHTGTTTGSWTFHNCQFNAKYDTCQHLGTNPNQYVTYINCEFNATGPTTTTPQKLVRAITAYWAGRANFIACKAVASSTASTDQMIYGVGFNAESGGKPVYAELYGCTVTTSAPSGFPGSGASTFIKGEYSFALSTAGSRAKAVDTTYDSGKLAEYGDLVSVSSGYTTPWGTAGLRSSSSGRLCGGFRCR